MALNPIVFTEKVVRSFLRYQLTAYPFADERLHGQMRQLLSLDETRRSPLLKGPYVSVSRPFRQGAEVSKLIEEGIFHAHMRQRIPVEITHVYGHQEDAIRAIGAGKTTLVATGTGSGKTECFLYPIVSRCLTLKDQGMPAGISAIIVYPMNALAEDQLWRLRSLLAGTGITFGMYVGKTPEHEHEVAGVRLLPGTSRATYEAKLAEVRAEKRGDSVYPPEEVCSREVMRTPGKQPRILLTNVKQLELLLTRQRDVELFVNARLDFLVFDEAHTFSGAQGAETACLIRRLRAFCGRSAQETVCIATSATIADKENPGAAQQFASRFFGVPANSVVTVGEAYEAQVWAEKRAAPPKPTASTAELLASTVSAVEDESGSGDQIREIHARLGGEKLGSGPWQQALYSSLSRNELVYQLDELLAAPRPLHELPSLIETRLGRGTDEAEVLTWLTLAAAARDDGRPLLRPVVHNFVRGISGAVVSFREDGAPKLWLAAEDEIASTESETRSAHLPVTTCTVCGQHYLVAFLKDFRFTGKAPEGGQASGDSYYWEPLEEAQGGKRAVLVDLVVGGGEDEDLDEHHRLSSINLCRQCGAAHPTGVSRCSHCSATGTMVPLYAVRTNDDSYLTSCLSCGSTGRRFGTTYREPARPVRATNVADVHVLAQDMVHHSERPRLLVFCDNRQDAAFQAGWMKDHARRFRLRALMSDCMADGPVSVGDLSLRLDERLEKDETLSRALVPEVWQVVRKEGGGGRHEQERRKFLRIQVLREVTLSSRQAIGLEPWGRMKVEYQGLESSLPWIQQNARTLGMPAESLREGVASLLDYFRRKRVLFDPEREIFTKYWMDGDLEILQGYLVQTGSPSGTKLRRASTEKPELVTQWLSAGGDTTIRQIARKWGVAAEGVEDFLEGLFKFLVKQKLLKPVTLKGARGNALPLVTGVYQVDADCLRLQQNHGVWRCRSCRRRTTRRTPNDLCPAWRCKGTLDFVQEDPDNYDLQLLDQGYSMLRPEEHTAMVPHEERERLENLFKGDSDAVNAFVCTPTLELGVDIGQLDAVLMRNVPPLPANYWQRAGRAGRRHRMAVDVTYCRPVSHDRAYFASPLKMLAGRVDPPAFNLRNDLMVSKHVHATVITRLHQYVRDTSRSEDVRQAIETTLRSCIPDRISDYLFEGGVVRDVPFELSPLRHLIDQNVDDLTASVGKAFRQGWPESDKVVTEPEVLRRHVTRMVSELDEVIARLRRRLQWALDQKKRLHRIGEQKGTLDSEEDQLLRRCDNLIKRLKGTKSRARREAEGYDDSNTFGVLAAEGFLPGYGLEVGSVLAMAEIPFWRTGAMDFVLPRPPSVALREYVPGNLIYANGNRFVARRFHRDIDDRREEMPAFELSTERQAIKETNLRAAASTLGAGTLQAISVCDVDLIHQSHISDEEELRFQLPVTVYGYERSQHNGGRAFKWGAQDVHHRRGVRMRLVNIGASRAIERGPLFGYPVCTVCGQSVSPLSSESQREDFNKKHQERCGKKPEPIGFYADVTADVLSLPACDDRVVACSVLESLRMAATRVLDMHMEDLQLLVIGHVDREEVDGLLWDPMPGGSGLIDQICERFSEIVEVAKQIVDDCPSACEASCIDCLQTFRNTYYHKFLDRRVAGARFGSWGSRIQFSHDIPLAQAAQEPTEGHYPVNEAERRLRHLLRAAGFEEGIRGQQIQLDRAIGTTTPDVIYRGPHHGDDEAVCIYLDGLGSHLHGNSKTAEQDRRIRTWLRNNGYEVIEITYVDLDDREGMTRHFRKLAGYLNRSDVREHLREDSSWFDKYDEVEKGSGHARLRLVKPTRSERYVRCVPLVPLKAAAGAFGDPQVIEEGEWDWVEVDTGRQLKPGMFVSQVVGKSMEPRIPDGSYCLFSFDVAGSRQGKVILVGLTDQVDRETGERFTVKKYESEKRASEDVWRHTTVRLLPLNPAFEPIVLTSDDEETVRAVAEFLEIL